MHRILESVNHVAGLAPAPHHLVRLSSLLCDANADVEEVHEIIRCDPNLTVSILRWCNSAMFRGTEPVTSTEEALLRIGFNPVVELVMILATTELYALPPEAETHLGGLWNHCLLTALLTRELARHRSAIARSAFTAGLLHDIGKVLLIKAAPKEYSRTLERAMQRHKPCVDQEEEEFGSNHATIAGEILGRWRLPSQVVTGIWYHHHASLSGAEHPLGCCIELADALAYAVGNGLKGQYTRHRETSALLETLGVEPTAIAEILRVALAELEEMKPHVMLPPCKAPSFATAAA